MRMTLTYHDCCTKPEFGEVRRNIHLIFLIRSSFIIRISISEPMAAFFYVFSNSIRIRAIPFGEAGLHRSLFTNTRSYGRGGGVGRGLGVGRPLGVGLGLGVEVGVGLGVAVAVGVGVAVAVAVAVGVGVGVPPPPGAWIPTVMGDPVLKKPTVALALCGG